MSFFIAGSLEKDTIFGAARKIFGPSYIETALLQFFSCKVQSFLGLNLDKMYARIILELRIFYFNFFRTKLQTILIIQNYPTLDFVPLSKCLDFSQF